MPQFLIIEIKVEIDSVVGDSFREHEFDFLNLSGFASGYSVTPQDVP